MHSLHICYYFYYESKFLPIASLKVSGFDLENTVTIVIRHQKGKSIEEDSKYVIQREE